MMFCMRESLGITLLAFVTDINNTKQDNFRDKLPL